VCARDCLCPFASASCAYDPLIVALVSCTCAHPVRRPAMSLTLHTSVGDMKVELECGAAPKLTENFLALAASGAYDGTLFHRNVAGFIVQGGDPTGTGKGGEAVHGGKLADEFGAGLSHSDRGIVAMVRVARAGPWGGGRV